MKQTVYFGDPTGTNGILLAHNSGNILKAESQYSGKVTERR